MTKAKMNCQHEDVKKEYWEGKETYICYACGKVFQDWEEVLRKREKKDK